MNIDWRVARHLTVFVALFLAVALRAPAEEPGAAATRDAALEHALSLVRADAPGDRRPWDAADPQVAVVFALWRAEALRDADTGRHLDRVRPLAALLARALRERPGGAERVPESLAREMYYAAALHDLGKVGIRDAVLLAPGTFTPEQREEMKQHSELGAAALADIDELFPGNPLVRRAAEVALNHHERWNGGGYPKGLAGTAIPLSARIMAVADVYDALSHERVYKPAFSPEKSAAIINDGSGTLFDPEIVAVFNEREDGIRRLFGFPLREPAATDP